MRNHLNFAFEFHEGNYKVSKKIGKLEDDIFGETNEEGTFFLGDGSFSAPLQKCKDEQEGNALPTLISKRGS